MKIDSEKMNGPILAVYANDRLYAGSGCELVEVETGVVLCKHSKSIRCITGDDRFVACCSFDGTASILDSRTYKFVERIEGPETEMKGIAVENDLVAIATRGRTVWILENLEISKILDDHLQDVKGCRFEGGRLYSWSYDNTVKMYEQFLYDHSWELVQSIDLGSIVWNVLFVERFMYAMLHDGRVVRLVMRNALWQVDKEAKLSIYPIMASCVVGCSKLAVLCNRNCLAVVDSSLGLLFEAALVEEGSERGDILSCCYWKVKNAVVCGGEYSTLYKVYLDGDVC